MDTEQKMSKADLALENERLKQDLATLVTEREETETALRSMEDRINAIEATRERSHTHDLAPEIVYDPFDDQNPHAIKSHPEGWVLSWKNPNWRAHRGWRGWVPITHDDEIGQKLHEYLADPPARMEGMSNIDNYVRRGTDSILCKLPAALWEKRQQDRSTRSRFKREGSMKEVAQGGDNYSYYGEGVSAQQPAITGDVHSKSKLFR